MFVSESIYFLILFTLPAALNIIYNVHIRFVPIIRKDKSVEIAECIVFCMAVFFVNMLIMQKQLLQLAQYLLIEDSAKAEFCISTGFDYLRFLIQYFIVNLVTSIFTIVVWYTLGQWLFRKVKNIIIKRVGRDEEKKFSDVWSTLFETNEFVDVSECVVKIEKGGELVTAGLIRVYPSPAEEKKEIALYNTDYIKELFEDDKEKEVAERIFPCSKCEYYDISNDVLLKFYEADRYDALDNEPE